MPLQIPMMISVIVLGVSSLSRGTRSERSSTDILNVCMDNMHHKSEPGPEGELYNQCSPWKNRSCCLYNTTRDAHHVLYGFSFDHCDEHRKMSSGCRRHFMQDFCFFECSPNVGPWITKVNGMKTRKERFFKVPLCQSDCDAWFKSCSNDYTCTDNWIRNFHWNNGRNYCPEGSICRTFAEVYGTADNFCKKVWDMSWEPVPDEEPCMRLWFNPIEGNPNDQVAQHYAAKLENMRSDADLGHLALYLLYSSVISLLGFL